MSPVVAALLACLPPMNERMSWQEAGGMVLAVSGVAWVVAEPRQSSGWQGPRGKFGQGVLLSVLGTGMVAAGFVLSKLGMTDQPGAPGIAPFPATVIRLLAATPATWLSAALLRMVGTTLLAAHQQLQAPALDLGRAQVAEFFQRVAHLVVELDRIDIECRATLVRHQREGERQWRMRHVGAADVEGPGHVLRIGHQQQVGAQFVDFGADALELVGGALAGELELAQAHGAGRRGRAVAPQRVDWVVVDRHQFGAGMGAGGPQLLGIVGCVQPGIVTELAAALEMTLEP